MKQIGYIDVLGAEKCHDVRVPFLLMFTARKGKDQPFWLELEDWRIRARYT